MKFKQTGASAFLNRDIMASFFFVQVLLFMSLMFTEMQLKFSSIRVVQNRPRNVCVVSVSSENSQLFINNHLKWGQQ